MTLFLPFMTRPLQAAPTNFKFLLQPMPNFWRVPIWPLPTGSTPKYPSCDGTVSTGCSPYNKALTPVTIYNQCVKLRCYFPFDLSAHGAVHSSMAAPTLHLPHQQAFRCIRSCKLLHRRPHQNRRSVWQSGTVIKCARMQETPCGN